MLNSLQIKVRKKILEMSFISQKGHLASAFSIIEILWVLYDKVLYFNINNPHDNNRDRFILSKGHASLALYVILAEKGFIEDSELDTFCEYNSRLGGHPHRGKLSCIEASTGSLGHGLPIAIGISMGLKIKKIEKEVYVLVGDGECNEGSIWESALLASNHKLDNLVLIIDYNHSNDRALNLGDLASKFTSFGWYALSLNGNDIDELSKGFLKLKNIHDKPKVLIANTVKGFGLESISNNPAWHHRSPNEQELILFMNELEDSKIKL
jgi:transketolase